MGRRRSDRYSYRRSDRFRSLLEDQAADAIGDAIDKGREQQSAAPTGGLRERRVEWISWGISVIILGLSLTVFAGNIPPLSGQNDALWFIFPLSAGGLMLLSAFLQKIINNWNVSIFTWAMGAILSALAFERFVAIWIIQDRMFRLINYIGTLVVLVGLIIVLQIFRRA